MSTSSISPVNLSWQTWEKGAFRFFFLFFVLELLPIDASSIHQLVTTNWFSAGYAAIFNLTRYKPWISALWDGYSNFLILAIIALIGAIIWFYADRPEKTDFEWLHKWLRILLRYRLAIGLLGYGMLKFFPLLAPFPSISNLNTPYGDFTRWKLFSMSLGIVPGYQTFLGLVEILAALLLLNRKTTTIGAGIVLFFTGNVFMSNVAYGNGEGYYSLYLILMALFLLAFDARRIYWLVFQQKVTVPKDDALQWKPGWQRRSIYLLKSLLIFFFVIFYGIKTYAGLHRGDFYQLPHTKGIIGSAGLYNVTVFQINGHRIPYSATDSIRWQDIVFENWSTISIRSNQYIKLDSTNREETPVKDPDRDYELSGSGGRQYYHYTTDTINHVLLLQNKNPHYSRNVLRLHYSRPDARDWIFSGVNERGDSLYAEIQRIDKKYLLNVAAEKGRGNNIKL